MRARGHVLLLVMVAIVAAGISFTVLSQRLALGIDARGPAHVRTQALLLGRTALAAKVTGTREVATPEGQAIVEATKDQVTVRLAGGVAVVTADAERYSVTSPPPETP